MLNPIPTAVQGRDANSAETIRQKLLPDLVGKSAVTSLSILPRRNLIRHAVVDIRLTQPQSRPTSPSSAPAPPPAAALHSSRATPPFPTPRAAFLGPSSSENASPRRKSGASSGWSETKEGQTESSSFASCATRLWRLVQRDRTPRSSRRSIATRWRVCKRVTGERVKRAGLGLLESCQYVGDLR